MTDTRELDAPRTDCGDKVVIYDKQRKGYMLYEKKRNRVNRADEEWLRSFRLRMIEYHDIRGQRLKKRTRVWIAVFLLMIVPFIIPLA